MVSKEWFDEFLKELTQKLGGATSLVRAPGEGLWRNCGMTERDNVAVTEVMAAKLAPEFWRSLRQRLETELSQEQIVIRAQEVIPL
ncbi:hypothetical protein V5279_05600 [Bradyrhizobium sp. 26S5]|uniref:hypothetical protein n=1 Tax=Bradyrhizobium sp. 26S5 TaxID=3139729 RepID=UPI0030D62688